MKYSEEHKMKRIVLLAIIALGVTGCDSEAETEYYPDGMPKMKGAYAQKLQLDLLLKQAYDRKRQYEEQQRRYAAGMKPWQERNKIELTIGMEYGEALDKWGTPDGFTSYETADEFTIVIEYGLPKDTTLTFRDYELFSIQKH